MWVLVFFVLNMREIALFKIHVVYEYVRCVGVVWAPFKPRSQHANATYRIIVGRNMLCAFGHPVETCFWLKFDNFQT